MAFPLAYSVAVGIVVGTQSNNAHRNVESLGVTVPTGVWPACALKASSRRAHR
jgi:hypothetical protein